MICPFVIYDGTIKKLIKQCKNEDFFYLKIFKKMSLNKNDWGRTFIERTFYGHNFIY
jgi:hypothetical protein